MAEIGLPVLEKGSKVGHMAFCTNCGADVKGAFCQQCGTRVPHKIRTTINVLIPAGCLDGDPVMRPRSNIFWKSKADWYIAPDALPKYDEYSA